MEEKINTIIVTKSVKIRIFMSCRQCSAKWVANNYVNPTADYSKRKGCQKFV